MENIKQPLTIAEAALCFGYGYKLVDKEGNEWDIMAVHTTNFRIFCPTGHRFLDNVFCEFSQIGTDCFILCRPLSQLTQTITVEGKEIVPLIECAKLSFPNPDKEFFEDMDWFMYQDEAILYNTGMESGYSFRYDDERFVVEGHDYDEFNINQKKLFQYLNSLHFDTEYFIGRGLGKELTEKT